MHSITSKVNFVDTDFIDGTWVDLYTIDTTYDLSIESFEINNIGLPLDPVYRITCDGNKIFPYGNFGTYNNDTNNNLNSTLHIPKDSEAKLQIKCISANGAKATGNLCRKQYII